MMMHVEFFILALILFKEWLLDPLWNHNRKASFLLNIHLHVFHLVVVYITEYTIVFVWRGSSNEITIQIKHLIGIRFVIFIWSHCRPLSVFARSLVWNQGTLHGLGYHKLAWDVSFILTLNRHCVLIIRDVYLIFWVVFAVFIEVFTAIHTIVGNRLVVFKAFHFAFLVVGV